MRKFRNQDMIISNTKVKMLENKARKHRINNETMEGEAAGRNRRINPMMMHYRLCNSFPVSLRRRNRRYTSMIGLQSCVAFSCPCIGSLTIPHHCLLPDWIKQICPTDIKRPKYARHVISFGIGRLLSGQENDCWH